MRKMARDSKEWTVSLWQLDDFSGRYREQAQPGYAWKQKQACFSSEYGSMWENENYKDVGYLQ